MASGKKVTSKEWFEMHENKERKRANDDFQAVIAVPGQQPTVLGPTSEAGGSSYRCREEETLATVHGYGPLQF
jgi:hypothetical protein